MRALVTGISGFVGGHLAELLLASGDVVVGLSTSGRWPEVLAHLADRVRIESCDLANVPESDLADLIGRKQPEVIYHLAAQANPQASVADPRGTWALNLGGTLTLLEAARKSGLKPRVVIVGSGVCYGNPSADQMPVDESCPLRPNNPYSASKGAADLLGVQHYLSHGTDVVMARPFNHAGPRQSSTYVLGGLARQVAEVRGGARSPGSRLATSTSSATSPTSATSSEAYRLLATLGASRRDLQPRLGPRDQAVRRPRRPSGSWPGRPSRSTSTPPASGRSTSPSSWPTRPSSAKATGWEAATPIETDPGRHARRLADDQTGLSPPSRRSRPDSTPSRGPAFMAMQQQDDGLPGP